MGANAENASTHVRGNGLGGDEWILFYGGPGVAHTCPKSSNGDDLPLVPMAMLRLCEVAKFDAYWGSGGEMVAKALEEMGDDYKSWWDGMPTTVNQQLVYYKAALVDSLSRTVVMAGPPAP
jgi:hypothetical protein